MNIQKAGCILLDFNNKKVGLVYRKKQNDYSFPKGHLEPFETLEDCAVRETEEETGRQCDIIPSKTLPILSYTDSLGDKSEVHYYLARDRGPSSKVFDSGLVHDLVWKSFEDVADTLSYPNLIELWNDTKHIINEMFEKRK